MTGPCFVLVAVALIVQQALSMSLTTGKTVGVIGTGDVGDVLSNGFLKHGYVVVRGSRDPAKLANWLKEAEPKDKASVGTFEEASKKADIVVLAVGGGVAESAVEMCGQDNLKGKTVLDVTNPLAGPPDEGVFPVFAGAKDSLMEILQAKVPEAHFVKCFSSVGAALMVDPDFDGVKPSMFICGNNADAKKMATEILDKFGWETEDMGGVKSARAIEPLVQLWCLPLYGWGAKPNYAFKLLKKVS